MANSVRHHWAIITFLAIFTLFFSYKIIAHQTPFYDWDESIYIELGKEMVHNHSFVPTWEGKVWLDKPQLVPLFYGLVMQLTPFMPAEVSTRLATLYLSVVALYLVYKLYNTIVKEKYLTTVMVVMTAFTPIFLQRAQVVNTDIFLLIGWVGYLLFYEKKYWGLVFLGIGILSKSLLGFYPVALIAGMYTFQLAVKTITKKEYKKKLQHIGFHVGVLSIWYAVMFVFYGKAFWIQHIIESHTKRVTASIETHFGKRTFYFDVLLEQFKWVMIISVGGWLLFLKQWVDARKNLKKGANRENHDKHFLYANALLPWFAFLNLTKTKIHWYIFPALPQFPLLILYPLTLLKKYKKWYFGILAVVCVAICYQALFKEKLQNYTYSKLEPHHILAQEANTSCSAIDLLVDRTGRETMQTLKDMDLTITTSDWWGSHPSMMVYFNNKIDVYYDETAFFEQGGKNNHCMIVEEQDLPMLLNKQAILLKKEGDLLLFM
ncbi:hypothetical protein KC726_04880 [Candidatus Woesebacteria bacterium]|nr:hypothetical protein [Candidatus Woesebacteria bacterium]